MQTSFAQVEYINKKKQTRRDRFLAEIEKATPWDKLVAQIEPFYPKLEGRGRPPIGLRRILRMYGVQQCFGLSDEGTAANEHDVTVAHALLHGEEKVAWGDSGYQGVEKRPRTKAKL